MRASKYDALCTQLLGARWILVSFLLLATSPCALSAQELTDRSIVHRVDSATDRLEMLVNSSRILTLDKKIPQVEVNNPDILDVTPRSPNQIQLFAKLPGVTQVNLWDDAGNVHAIDVVVYADARELAMILHTQFPTASLKVVPLANSVVISGFVDNPGYVARIIEIAEDFHPKVINNIRVGGVQQVLLKVRAMEVSRTKLRNLGFDFSDFGVNATDFVTSGISGVMSSSVTNAGVSVASTGGQTLAFGVMEGNNQFFGLLEALRQNNLLKVLAEPNLVAVSGRPAQFNVGGEFPILVPQSLGTVSIQYKKFGTQLDFVPIVLGNGYIRLEVRPRVSEIDDTRSVVINNVNVPALRVREAETGVELRSGQTLALAGLVQTRVEAENRGLPYLSDWPYVGALFRRVRERTNEIELLILVTPELVDAMDCWEVPEGGPGTTTCSPSDRDLYWRGHLETPCCGDGSCGACDDCQMMHEGAIMLEDVEGMPIHDGPVYDSSPAPANPLPQPAAEARLPAMTVESATPLNRNIRRDSSRNPAAAASSASTQPPGLIGPIGYDEDN